MGVVIKMPTSKPIMRAGHPGDLKSIVISLRNRLDTIEQSDLNNGEKSRQCGGLAIAGLEALEMWLGRRTIPMDVPGDVPPIV